MENDREFEQVLMNVRNTSGGISSAIMLSARMSMLLVVFIMRMVKKGLIAASYADNIKSFAQMTEGKYQIYNIPLSEDRAQYMMRLNEIELHLQQEKNPIKRRTLEKEKKELKEKLPEIEQLKKLNVKHCVLPKLNGSERTIQIAVSADSEPLFKNWFINHLTSELSGGEKELEDIKNFTEGNYSIFNVPFEGEELKEVLPDFDTLGINYAVLPDLKFDAFYRKFVLNVKGDMSHPIEIGVDPFGNLTRINNALEAMPTELEEAQTKLANVEHQLETAKIEVNKPFLQEAELSEKLKRLAELDALLNMGEKEDSIIENTTEDIIEPVITPANKFTKRVKPRGPKL